MRRRWQSALAATAAVCLFPAPSAAAPAREAAKLERRQAEESKKARALAKQAAAADVEISRLNESLSGLAVRRSQTEAAATAAQIDLDLLKDDVRRKSAALARDRDTLELLLIGFLQSERAAEIAPSRFAAPPGSMVMAHLLTDALAANAADKRARIDEAQAMSVAIALRREALIDQTADLDRADADARARLAETAEAKRALEQQAKAAEARSRELARQARTLRELAARVAAESRTRALSVSLGGKRVAPAAGEIVHRFGAADGAGAPASGVTVRTAASASVLAPADSVVAFAGPFRSYGQVLILEQGNGYALVLTGLDTVFSKTGQTVAAGAVVGRMSSGATTAPELYFEVRQSGRPIDPERWLKTKG
jgi:septal ring factor EnvC (AmiA/AmiB activator)